MSSDSTSFTAPSFNLPSGSPQSTRQTTPSSKSGEDTGLLHGHSNRTSTPMKSNHSEFNLHHPVSKTSSFPDYPSPFTHHGPWRTSPQMRTPPCPNLHHNQHLH
eukprot:4303961-Amphidinium_carterae.2